MASRSKSSLAGDGPLAGRRVLVVDDHSFTISLIKDVLYASGALSVHTALDGGEALAMLRICHPHLVVTDWRMPGMDGLAFTELVRQAERHPDPRIPDPQVPILLLSAHASVSAVEVARRAGVNEVVVKPFTIAALLERMVAAVTKPRAFVVSDAYIGPDRRRRRIASGVAGRRSSDQDIHNDAAEAQANASVLKRLQAELEMVERDVRKPAKKAASR